MIEILGHEFYVATAVFAGTFAYILVAGLTELNSPGSGVGAGEVGVRGQMLALGSGAAIGAYAGLGFQDITSLIGNSGYQMNVSVSLAVFSLMTLMPLAVPHFGGGCKLFACAKAVRRIFLISLVVLPVVFGLEKINV